MSSAICGIFCDGGGVGEVRAVGAAEFRRGMCTVASDGKLGVMR